MKHAPKYLRALSIPLLLALGSCGTQEERGAELAEAISSLGYTVIRPPSQLMPPGSVVTVTTVAPFQARVVCSRAGAIGDASPSESPTQSSEWSRKAKTGFGVSADIADKVNATIGAERVREISLSLSNTRVLELTDDTVVQAAMDGSTSDACKAALQARAATDAPLTMIRSVLQADVVYTLHFTTDLSADAKLAILEAAAPELLAHYKLDGNDTITGTALFFGVVDDFVLLQELMQNAGAANGAPQNTDRDESRRLLGKEVAVQY